MTAEFMIILAILVIGYGALVLHYLHDCKKTKKERGEDDGVQ